MFLTYIFQKLWKKNLWEGGLDPLPPPPPAALGKERVYKFMVWNGYPQHVRCNIILNFDQSKQTNPTNLNEKHLDEKDGVLVIWLHIPDIDPQGKFLVRKCISKLKRCMKDKNIKFIVMHNTKEMVFFCLNMDKTPDGLRSNIINGFSCPGCSAKYVGKTERCLYI